MAYNERHAEIQRIISRLKTVTVQELTERLKVSEVTIRKDLSLLEEQGLLLRTHGGAVLAEDTDQYYSLQLRSREHLKEKQAIARRAADLIHEGDTIFIDSGSTCYFLLETVKDMSLRVVSNSLDIMAGLASSPNITLISVGGNFRREARSFIGPMAVENIHNFQIQTCFIGTTGFSKQGYFSCHNTIEAQLKKTVLESSSRRIVLADAGKYDVPAFTIFAKPENIDILITDAAFQNSQKLRDLGIEVIQVS